MTRPRRRTPRKAATNLSLREDLVLQARRLDLNLSLVMEAALEQAIRARQQETWLEENRAAIDEYNAVVEKRGVFSDGWRRF